MARAARQKSKSVIYHIILRGANRHAIFHNDDDCIRFLEILETYKNKSNINILAWCLMGNHVHLLLKEGNEELAVTMKRIGVSYASYYNWKYKTIGHLFQDRFKSENVENDSYLLTVTRYIHQNPVKAGIVTKPEEWKWSSCQSYYKVAVTPSSLLDDEIILSMFAEGKKLDIKRFKEFNESNNEDKHMDEDIRIRLTDDEAKEEIRKSINGYQIAQVKSLPKETRNEIISKLKRVEGLTQRQISKIFEIPLSMVNRA